MREHSHRCDEAPPQPRYRDVTCEGVSKLTHLERKHGSAEELLHLPFQLGSDHVRDCFLQQLLETSQKLSTALLSCHSSKGGSERRSGDDTILSCLFSLLFPRI